MLTLFVRGSAKTFNQQTNADLDNPYVVLDISELQGTLLPVGMFIALDYIWDKAKGDRTERKAIFIDEIWKLMQTPHSADFVHEIFKIIRGYAGAAIASTQDFEDFFAFENGKYGKAVINNSNTKICLQLLPDESEMVRGSLRLTEAEVMQVIQFDKGEGFISTNNTKVPVRLISSKREELLITTDRKLLDAQVQEQKRLNALEEQQQAASE